MISFSDAVVSDRLRALTRALDADPAGGKLLIYGGAQPTPGASASGALVTLNFPLPSLDSVTGSTLTLNEPPATMVDVTGDATWGRLTDGAGVWIADVTVGATGSGAVIVINSASTTIYAGAQLTVTVATLTEA